MTTNSILEINFFYQNFIFSAEFICTVITNTIVMLFIRINLKSIKSTVNDVF